MKLSAAGALGITTLAFIERLLPAADLPDSSPRRAAGGLLSTTEFHTLDVVAALLIGPSAGQPSTRDTRTAERVELELTKAQGKLASDVKAALKVLEYLPVFWGAGARLTRLPAARQAEALQRMRSSDNALVRSAYGGVRFLCVLFYYSDERAWPRIGYAGPMVPAKFFEGGNRIVNLPKLSGGSQ